jgi:RimJ/RimL family protein N-acetyltransferase
MKFLFDTNIVLGIEDNRPIDSTFSLLARKCSEHGINVVYLTAFERQTALITLLEKFGFRKTIY